MNNDPIEIARACYESYIHKNRTAIEALIADDFYFTSPLDNRIDRKTYFARCWPNSATIESFDYVDFVAHGEKVFVTYEGQNINGARFRNTEILTIHGYQIVDIEVYFGWNLPHLAPAGGFISPSM